MVYTTAFCNQTVGTAEVKALKASWASRVGEWLDGIKFPIGIPQLAPVAMMLLFAFLVFSQTVSADGSLTDVYQKSYRACRANLPAKPDAWNGKPADENQNSKQDPVTGTTYVDNEEKK